MINKEQVQKMGIKIIDTQENKNPLFDMLKTHFPQTISEGAVNFEVLKELLGTKPSNMQGYELTFTGKNLANALYNTPCQKELKFEESQSHNPQNSKNAIIRGDNLDVLKLLKASYSGKVKMIYIDPPYNTKNDTFIYPDNFREDFNQILKELGYLTIDEESGEEKESEALQYFRNITASRTHSAWLCFMLPRLKLARDLLRDDGVIFISIDDNEQANLKLLCDEIFGEENFVACVIWNSTKSVTNTALISASHTYNLVYAKGKDYYVAHREEFRLKEDGKGFSNPDNDPRGPWKADPFQVGGWRPNQQYDIVNPTTGKVYRPNPGCSWKNDYNKFLELLKDNRIVFGSDGTAGPQRKRFLSEATERGKVVKTLWDDVETTTNGTQLLKKILGGSYFDNPKPVSLIKRMLELSSKRDDIILDFFAGSGTSAHAVMELNAEDGGNRQFILVQIDEAIDAKKSKSAYDFCKNELHSKEPFISDITIERVKRASQNIAQKCVNENADLGFKVYKLEDKTKLIANEQECLNLVYQNTLTPLDKARNLALQSGKTLDKDLKIVFEDELYFCEDSYYLIHCTKEILEHLRKTPNAYIFFSMYEDISLEDLLNLQSFAKERLQCVV
ncbi:site-specific DNA-methyltransferase [Campylobacter cuniculorum]|uniref:site-specific DNA-methyltransferase n=1 Tax=Campylobacter cuniculorum TaxID=374106 RepID=UPI0023F32218|nr:site-specific DNA-methyltransferase [Campylobacter cuniculorum]